MVTVNKKDMNMKLKRKKEEIKEAKLQNSTTIDEASRKL